MFVLILLYVSSYSCMCVLMLLCVLILLYIYVSSYYYIFFLILSKMHTRHAATKKNQKKSDNRLGLSFQDAKCDDLEISAN